MVESLLIIIDPIPTGHSVQFDLFCSLASSLKKTFKVTISSLYVDQKRIGEFGRAGISVLTVPRKSLHLDSILALLKKNNESMLWLESWLREVLFRRNTQDFATLYDTQDFDYIINATNTIPIESDIWWTQGPPLLTTVKEMSEDNMLARLAMMFGSALLDSLDMKLISEMLRKSRMIVANSKYSSKVYSAMGASISGVVFNTKDFTDFRPSTQSPTGDYVLTYIGKETDIDAILDAVDNGLKVIGFGSKTPIGGRTYKLHKAIDFRGRVTNSQLIDLYSNALFTLFPFTNEPLGYVPLESMACGTPVLTYGKQGPSETVVDGITGWFASDRRELVEMAVSLWNDRMTSLNRSDCQKRASMFGASQAARQLSEILRTRR